MTITTAIGLHITAPSQAIAMQMLAMVDWAQVARGMAMIFDQVASAEEVLLLRIEVPLDSPAADAVKQAS